MSLDRAETSKESLAKYTFRELAEKTEAMREFRRLRDAGLPIPIDVRDRHVQATNDGYTTGPEPTERVPDFTLPDQRGGLRRLEDLAEPGSLFLYFTARIGDSTKAPGGRRQSLTFVGLKNSGALWDIHGSLGGGGRQRLVDCTP